jgi:hypothetical protein
LHEHPPPNGSLVRAERGFIEMVCQETAVAKGRRFGIALLLFVVGGGCAEGMGDDPSTQPQGTVDMSNYVHVPTALVHPSCVREVPADATIDANGAIVHANGSVEAIPACAYPSQPSAVQIGGGQAPALNGWIESASFSSNYGIKHLYADFQVPTAPATQGSQLIYFFPALEHTRDNAVRILQPVLQWGTSPAGGGQFWGIASWIGPFNGVYYHSGLVQVWHGNVIHGNLQGSNCSGNACANWTVTSTNTGNGQSTSLSISNNIYGWWWVFGGALEAYGITDCSYFPASGSIPFTSIYAYDVNGTLLGNDWDKWYADHSCNEGIGTTGDHSLMFYYR